MFKILLGLIFRIRDVVQRQFGKQLERFRDPSTGKITFAKPKTLKKIILTVSLVIFFLILVSQIVGTKVPVGGGLETFEKELKPSTGVNFRELRNGAAEDDPFKGIGQFTRDQYGTTERNRSDFTGVINGTEGGPSVQDCATVIDKMKENKSLSAEETTLAKTCIETNVTGLTPDEIAFANAMLDPNTSAKEKEVLARALSGNASMEELAVAKALASGNDNEKAMARAAIAGGADSITALGRSLTGKELTPEQQALVDKMRADVAAGRAGGVGGGPVQQQAANNQITTSSGQTIPVDLQATTEALKAASQEIANNEDIIKGIEETLANQQLAVSPISEKLAGGQTVTNTENKLLQDFTATRSKLDGLKKDQETRKTSFAARVSKAQTGLAQAVSTVQRSLPSGSTIEYDGEAFDCSKIKPLAVKKRAKKVTVAKKEKVLDLDGRELKPEEVEFIKLQRKKMYELAQNRKDAINPSLEGLGTPANIAAMGNDGQPVGITDLQTLVVFKDAGLKNFELTPDMKIPAVLDSQILVSDKGKAQIVRVRILDDVHNPQNNEILIPKGAVATGMTGGFDDETGVMDLTFDRVMIGSGKSITVRLAVGSADGTMGLKGRIHDTTGKYLLGAFITSFSAGALGYFSQQYVTPYQQSTIAATAIQGSGLAGAADVAQKISELYASKLQNAAKVFWVPKGVPVVLNPL